MLTYENHYYSFYEGGCHIGQCACRPSRYLENAVELWCFGIYGEYRGKGLGQQFLREIIEHNAGRVIVLFVEKTNARAIHIYKKAGFKIVGEYRGGSYAWEMRRG